MQILRYLDHKLVSIIFIYTLLAACHAGTKTANYGLRRHDVSENGDLSAPDANGIRHQLPRQRRIEIREFPKAR